MTLFCFAPIVILRTVSAVAGSESIVITARIAEAEASLELHLQV